MRSLLPGERGCNHHLRFFSNVETEVTSHTPAHPIHKVRALDMLPGLALEPLSPAQLIPRSVSSQSPFQCFFHCLKPGLARGSMSFPALSLTPHPLGRNKRFMSPSLPSFAIPCQISSADFLLEVFWVCKAVTISEPRQRVPSPAGQSSLRSRSWDVCSHLGWVSVASVLLTPQEARTSQVPFLFPAPFLTGRLFGRTRHHVLSILMSSAWCSVWQIAGAP